MAVILGSPPLRLIAGLLCLICRLLGWHFPPLCWRPLVLLVGAPSSFGGNLSGNLCRGDQLINEGIQNDLRCLRHSNWWRVLSHWNDFILLLLPTSPTGIYWRRLLLHIGFHHRVILWLHMLL